LNQPVFLKRRRFRSPCVQATWRLSLARTTAVVLSLPDPRMLIEIECVAMTLAATG